MNVFYFFLVLAGVLLLPLLILRIFDKYADQTEWARLLTFQPKDPSIYQAEMVADLPEPAKRFFNYAISVGTPLLPVVEIEMKGKFSLGTKDKPNYQSMQAKQILASPQGFVWRLSLPGGIPVSGSDSAKWTRFRILGVIPVARMGGDPDHTKSAFARYVAESVFWSPASVLPGRGITWVAVDSNTARVTITHGALSQSVDVKVNADGQPLEVIFSRWTNANTDKEFRFQPFGGVLSNFQEVVGYRLPFSVEAGNMYGTADYFAFYKAEISNIRFPENSD